LPKPDLSHSLLLIHLPLQTSLDGLKGAFRVCEGVTIFDEYGNTRKLSEEMDDLIGRFVRVCEIR
jgi:hypothetical protein